MPFYFLIIRFLLYVIHFRIFTAGSGLKPEPKHFGSIEDDWTSNRAKAHPRFHEDKSPIQTRPRENGDKTVTNPSLKAGVSGYTPYQGFSPDGTATCLQYVEKICQLVSTRSGRQKLFMLFIVNP